MSESQTLIRFLTGATEIVRHADPTGWSPDEWDRTLDALETVTYEVDGLASRIRAARERVNGTPVEHPVKPIKQDPPPQDPPKDPPPAEPGEGT